MCSSQGSIGGFCLGLLPRRCLQCASWSSGSPPSAWATASFPWRFGYSRSAAASCSWFMRSIARTSSSSPARRLACSSTCVIFNSCCATANQLLLRSRSEEHTSELQSHVNLVCRLLLEKKKKKKKKQEEKY